MYHKPSHPMLSAAAAAAAAAARPPEPAALAGARPAGRTRARPLQVDLYGVRVDLCTAATVRTLVGERLQGNQLQGDQPQGDQLRGDQLRGDQLRGDQLRAAELRGDQAAPLFVASANLDHLHHFGRHGGHRAVIDRRTADWLVLLDGAPMVATARRLTGRHWPQLAGSDLLPELLDVAVGVKARVGFLGGRPEMHRRLRTTLAGGWPDLPVAGFWAPLRAELTDPDQAAWLVEEIRRTGVDLLVVGLGKPLQEEFLARHGRRSGARVALAFGAAADFLAGEVSRAPRPIQRMGLEWLYRLAREPRRLARRYLRYGPPAMFHLLFGSSLVPAEPESRTGSPK